AEGGSEQARPQADAALREQVQRLLRDWTLADPNPEAYSAALQRMSRAPPLFVSSPAAESPAEPERVVAMALEVETVGPGGRAAGRRALVLYAQPGGAARGPPRRPGRLFAGAPDRTRRCARSLAGAEAAAQAAGRARAGAHHRAQGRGSAHAAPGALAPGDVAHRARGRGTPRGESRDRSRDRPRPARARDSRARLHGGARGVRDAAAADVGRPVLPREGKAPAEVARAARGADGAGGRVGRRSAGAGDPRARGRVERPRDSRRDRPHCREPVSDPVAFL